MNVDVPPARVPDPLAVRTKRSRAAAGRSPSRTGDAWLVLGLSRFVDAQPAVRLGAIVRPGAGSGDADVAASGTLLWPLAATPPRGLRELAARSLASGRVTRVPVTIDALGAEELLALPLVPCAGENAIPSVLVLALGALHDLAREALVRAARERFGAATPHARKRVPAERSPATPNAADAMPRSATLADATPGTATPGALVPVDAAKGGGTSDGPGDSAGEQVGEQTGEQAGDGSGDGSSGGTDPNEMIERAVLDAVARHGDAASAALAVADAAATALGCVRVTLGVGAGRGAALLAVSGESRVDGRRELGRRLVDVVAEGLARGGAHWPGGPADLVAHRRLHALDGAGPILSVAGVSAAGERVVAVLERTAGQPFAEAARPHVAAALEPALALIGSLHAHEKGPGERLRASVRHRLGQTRAGRVPARTVLIAAATAAFAFACLVPLPYRVAGRVLIEASDRQVLVAPEAGHIRAAHARAGDRVAAGELLATLDDRELALSLDSWRSELAKNRTERSRALAVRDRVELARLRADALRIDAELALVEARRARGEIRAPFAGVVLSGDPTRSLGAPVAAGDVLFEIGAGERSLAVSIDERDVALVAAGARTRVRMASSPRRVREARLEPIVPVAVDEDGREVFRVPATLADGDGDALSPGMRGVARIEAGRRTLASAWTRTLRESLLLLAWRFGLVR